MPLQQRHDELVLFTAKLLLLCDLPKEKKDMVFKRVGGRVGDYMGSGYYFTDAFNELWDEFVYYCNDLTYAELRNAIDKIKSEEQKNGET